MGGRLDGLRGECNFETGGHEGSILIEAGASVSRCELEP